MRRFEFSIDRSRRAIELDFLRGIAILMVIDFHSKSPILFAPLLRLGFPHFGWIGVDIFFVLSGFLIGSLLMQEWKRSGKIEVGTFLVRRSFKILPQYYVYLLVILFTGHRSFAALRANFLHVQNYYHGIPHTWSLAVEEHAYLLVLLLVSATLLLKIRARFLFALIAVLTVFVHILRFYLAQHGGDIYFATHTRIDGILSGVLFAMLYHFARRQFVQIQRAWYVWATILLLALAFFRWNPRGDWVASVQFDISNLCGIAMLMLFYQSKRGQTASLYRLVAWIGFYSYGIYIWHVSTLAPIANVGLRLSSQPAYIWNAIMPMAAAIVIGASMTMLIELPMLRLREAWFPRTAKRAEVSAIEPDLSVEPAAGLLSREVQTLLR